MVEPGGIEPPSASPTQAVLHTYSGQLNLTLARRPNRLASGDLLGFRVLPRSGAEPYLMKVTLLPVARPNPSVG